MVTISRKKEDIDIKKTCLACLPASFLEAAPFFFSFHEQKGPLKKGPFFFFFFFNKKKGYIWTITYNKMWRAPFWKKKKRPSFLFWKSQDAKHVFILFGPVHGGHLDVIVFMGGRIGNSHPFWIAFFLVINEETRLCHHAESLPHGSAMEVYGGSLMQSKLFLMMFVSKAKTLGSIFTG